MIEENISGNPKEPGRKGNALPLEFLQSVKGFLKGFGGEIIGEIFVRHSFEKKFSDSERVVLVEFTEGSVWSAFNPLGGADELFLLF